MDNTAIGSSYYKRRRKYGSVADSCPSGPRSCYPDLRLLALSFGALARRRSTRACAREGVESRSVSVESAATMSVWLTGGRGESGSGVRRGSYGDTGFFGNCWDLGVTVSGSHHIL